MQKVLIGLSGGVDSAVSAYLLQKQGYDVTAGFMINYISDSEDCTTSSDIEEAKKVANFLGIKFFSFDYQQEYYEQIIRYIFDGYKKGYTPNPDILCNTKIKFDLFLKEAINLGFDTIATGHYARIYEDNENMYHLLKGVDNNKDQSYFLAGLKQRQLAKTFFPIGNMKKTELRQLARDINLPNADRKDSQGLCFVGNVDMKDFLKQELPEREGYTVDTSGNIIGKHNGVWFYTIGQRRGLGIGGSKAYFVVRKDIENNKLIVGDENEMELYSKNLITSGWHWVAYELELPQEGYGRIRHGQPLQKCKIFDIGNGKIKVEFEHKQRAIASGQIFAFYQGEELIGSGIIE